MAENSYQSYFKGIKTSYGQGTEYTSRTYFENLLNEIKPDKYINVIHEPKKDESISGRPDFKIEKNGLVMGYIETKIMGFNLDEIIKGTTSRESQQLKKYLKVSPNLILTNYHEFILFKNGLPVDRTVLFYPSTDKLLDKANISNLERLFTSFFTFAPKQIVSPKKLSSLLAERTKLFKDFLKDLLESEEENEFKNRLLGLKKVIEDTLIEDFSLDDFIDAYAQTITYGLFLAEINSKENISEDNAHKFIPKSMGILRDLFKTIDIEDIPDSIDWILEEIIDILNRIDRKELQNSFSFSKIYDYEDPYVYFYENFLGDYDKDKRKSKGVYYTPIPVVNFIVKSIEYLLKENFNLEGLKGEDIKVLDFATGTGTFLLEAFKIALEDTDEGLKDNLIHERLLKNYHGFEYLIAPYTIAHLKLSQYLKEIGYPLEDDERFKIYLTDTLDRSEHKGLDYFTKLTKEGLDANIIKITEDILVLMGNPPYSSESKNNKEWILKLTELYKKDVRKEETNIKPLNDDYVKFIRYAHWKIENNGQGIVGIISNNSYLDGLVHREMRKELLGTFDKIYILNLHGNKRKFEPDENVFDIQAGVNIALFIKLQNPLKDKEIYYYSTLTNNLTDRELKYGFLLGNSIDTINWEVLSPEEPYYWFIPKDNTQKEEYYNGWALNEIFKEFESGIKTQRDPVTIHLDKENLVVSIKDLLDLDDEAFKLKYNLPEKEGRDWKVAIARKSIVDDLEAFFSKGIEKSSDLDNDDWDRLISERVNSIQYRAFDNRWTYLSEKSKGFIKYPRWEIMRHLIVPNNKGIVFARKTSKQHWKHIFVTDKITDGHSISDWSYVAPLFLLDSEDNFELNFSDEFMEFIKKRYKQIKSPLQIFEYLYAILHSKTYLKKYNEFLKVDYPYVPFVDDVKKFRTLSYLGHKLIDVHLLKGRYSGSEIGLFPVKGDNLVNKIKYDKNSSNLFINKTQYFKNVPETIWKYEIGDYKVIDKWLKYRKGRNLDYSEINHIQKVLRALNESVSIMDEIDQVYRKLDL
ncbi:MAG: hypothetical protein FGO69_08685 [Methanobacterium sp.]|nr:MAG: hypothetical protein FGO69_08685 [Methanobacterium sp.]